MPIQTLSGTRLREKRLSLGIKQADLALAAGISASYLNLIEHNRRRIAPAILARLAQSLGIDATLLLEGAGNALTDDLRAAVADFAGAGAELEKAEDFAARFPGWAQLLVQLHDRSRSLTRAVAALNDRLSHDPHLSAALHDMLSVVSSVASTAAILHETPDIDADWRDRFLANLNRDGKRLAASAEGLVAFLDGTGKEGDIGNATPRQEVEQWLSSRRWTLGTIEASEGRQLLEDEAKGLTSGAARALAATFIAGAAADSGALPTPGLMAALASIGPDPAALAAKFGASVMQVFRRLPLLDGHDSGFVQCDGSGTVTLQKPIPGFAVPRIGDCCPLWPLFTALSHPATAISATVEVPSGMRFKVLAYCESRLPEGFGGPELREAAMLIMPMPPGSVGQSVGQGGLARIGPTCRICPRSHCPARREPSILMPGV